MPNGSNPVRERFLIWLKEFTRPGRDSYPDLFYDSIVDPIGENQLAIVLTDGRQYIVTVDLASTPHKYKTVGTETGRLAFSIPADREPAHHVYRTPNQQSDRYKALSRVPAPGQYMARQRADGRWFVSLSAGRLIELVMPERYKERKFGPEDFALEVGALACSYCGSVLTKGEACGEMETFPEGDSMLTSHWTNAVAQIEEYRSTDG